MRQAHDRNVFEEPLVPCSFDPVTGFLRDGCCRTEDSDVGAHIVCAVMTDAFLEFSFQQGNDLSTPRPQWQFPGLVAGDQWCLCLSRWIEAHAAGCAPLVVLESTNLNVLDYVSLDILKQYDHRPNGIAG
jgi:uncharacterized protein (DUF2237 family)